MNNITHLDRNIIAGTLVHRPADSHKGTFGTVLVIAGSSRMRGAAFFNVMGALRSGCGLVRLMSVPECINAVSVSAPEAVFIPVESDCRGFMKYDENALADSLKNVSAVVIGSGMGVTENTMKILRFVVHSAEIPVIIDADGINCISAGIELTNSKADIIITPHSGEMARLLRCTAQEVNSRRTETAQEYARKYNFTVVLKGAGTVIAGKNCTSINPTGNNGMSKGGSGDVLSGIIGSLAAQGIPSYKAACAGAYIHGLAGDFAAERFGCDSMIPSDLLNCLPEAFKSLRNSI